MEKCSRCHKQLADQRLGANGILSERVSLNQPAQQMDMNSDATQKESVHEQMDRCVFCHSADESQYVPAHFRSVGKFRSRLLQWETGLASHRACAGCWAAWEARHLPKPRPGRQRPPTPDQEHLSCPVCARHVDPRVGYPGKDLCHDCLDELLLKTPAPNVKPPSCLPCGCSTWVTVLVIFLISSVALQLLTLFLLKAVTNHVTGIEGALVDKRMMRQVLPRGLRTTICPMLHLMKDIGMDNDPFLSTAYQFGQMLCGGTPQRVARGSGEQQSDTVVVQPRQAGDVRETREKRHTSPDPSTLQQEL